LNDQLASMANFNSGERGDTTNGPGSGKPDDARESGDSAFRPDKLKQLQRRPKAAAERFQLDGEIGRGGMGAVLRVRDLDLQRNLAMKVVLGQADARASGETPPVDPQVLQRFLDEAQITGQLDHPGVVPVHELGVDDRGRVYFTMRLVKGDTADDVFTKAREGLDGWTETRALEVLLKVCDTMAFAHQKGVLHRDLKPSNVMVGKFGEVYVMDWGLAKVQGQPDHRDLRLRPESSVVSKVRTDRSKAEADSGSPLLTMDGAVVGTPSYMALEQAEGRLEVLDARADVYAVGAMLYQLLTGWQPYVRPGARVSPYAVLAAVQAGPPVAVHKLRKDAPAELTAICEKAMARGLDDRYPDMRALSEDLRAFVERRVVGAYEAGAWAEAKKWLQRNRALAAALAAAVLALVVGLTASLVFKARADERAAAARQELYVSAIRGAQSAMRLDEPEAVRRALDSAPEELRNWEWRYLDARSDTSLFVLKGGNSAAFSPDGKRIVTAGDNVARVYDAESGAELVRLEGHTGTVVRAAFSPDGARIVTASNDHTARVWIASSGRESVRLSGHAEAIRCAVFSPDGARIGTVSNDGTGRVWDARSGAEIALLRGGVYGSVSFSPDGARIVGSGHPNYGGGATWDAATGTRNSYPASFALKNQLQSFFVSPDSTRIVAADIGEDMYVWDVASGAELAYLSGHTDDVADAAFSADGTRLVTASYDRTVRVWDVANGKELIRLSRSARQVMVAFSPDGTRIVAASDQGVVRVWDAASGKEIAPLEGHVNFVSEAKFSPDGRRIVTASRDGTSRVWDAAGRKPVAVPRLARWNEDDAFDAFSPDARRILTKHWDDSARILDADTGAEILRLEGHQELVHDASFSPDGSRVVTASEVGRIWDAATGRELAQLHHAGTVRTVTFSSEATRIVTASSDDPVARVWDARSGKELARLEHARNLRFAIFGRADSRIVTVGWDGTARLWEAADGKEIAQIDERHIVWRAVFSPDGSRFATAGDDDGRVWDAVNGKEICRLVFDGSVGSAVAFRGDGKRIVAASHAGGVWVFDTATGTELLRLDGHSARVHQASFSPDGSRIVTASADSTVRVWDAGNGKELVRLEGHRDEVYRATFSSDGTRILTASRDGSARVWDCVPYRVRFAERQALLAVHPAAEVILAETLASSRDFVEAGAAIRDEASLEPIVRRQVSDLLSEHSAAGREKTKRIASNRAEAKWLSRMLGLEPWPSEGEVEAALRTEADIPWDEPHSLDAMATTLVDSDEPPGDAVRALVLSRRAVAEALPQWVALYRDTLARALFRLGRFDEALAEQRRAFEAASARAQVEYQGYLQKLEADIASWRDESGALRRDVWTEKLRALEREIAELEADRDVQLWMGKGR
jgi:WD40 repeat protein/serine/threonine protein kinase